MGDTYLKMDLQSNQKLGLQLQGTNSELRLGLSPPTKGFGTNDYDKLINRPQINGITLSGNMTAVDLGLVSENTSEGWDEMPLYVPKPGEICIYTDIGKMKIGDGSVPIVDLAFVNEADVQEIWDALEEHTQNASIHVSQEDRDRWDAKLNYEISGEILTLNRL